MPRSTSAAKASLEDQAKQVLANVQAALEAGSVAQLVQVRVYVTDIEQWPAFIA